MRRHHILSSFYQDPFLLASLYPIPHLFLFLSCRCRWTWHIDPFSSGLLAASTDQKERKVGEYMYKLPHHSHHNEYETLLVTSLSNHLAIDSAKSVPSFSWSTRDSTDNVWMAKFLVLVCLIFWFVEGIHANDSLLTTKRRKRRQGRT